MNKEYTSLGLMSGTSGDGIDASIIRSDGISKYEVLFNKYYKYQDNIYETIHAGIGLGSFFQELSNESYFGPGIKADFGAHYRMSKNFHIGTKLSWSHYWVKRDEKFTDEPQGRRTLSLTWLSFGLDIAIYL